MYILARQLLENTNPFSKFESERFNQRRRYFLKLKMVLYP